MASYRRITSALKSLALLSIILLLGGGARAAPPETAGPPEAPFKVDANVALASFVSLTDAHLQEMAHALQILATSDQARAADWKRIEPALAKLAAANAPALNWFALPDGSYWTVQNGREKGNLQSREYFPKVLAGKTVLGDLVVSKATGKSVAIVAVPVKRDGEIVGVLGASVHLDKLSERIREEMRVPTGYVFYTFDSHAVVALVWDPGLIFKSSKELGPEVEAAFSEMMKKDEGVARYAFREKERTVVYRRSPVTGWWYGFGMLEPPKTAAR